MSAVDFDIDAITALNNASTALNSYAPIFIYIFGTVGNCLNILVLSQRTLRSNPSAIYFLASSLAGIIVIISGLTSRMMSGYNGDLTLTVGWICKIRNVVLYSFRTVVFWMIVCATIDRWLSSSTKVNYRQMSNMKNVRRSIIAVMIYTCIINSPILYCYEANVDGALRSCYGSTYSCRLITDLIYAFGIVLLPLTLMTIFGLLTIRNVRQVQTRVQTITAINSNSRSTTTTTIKRDQELFRMLLIQITLLLLFNGPHAIQKVYTSFSSNTTSDNLTDATTTLIFNIFTLLAFVASSMPFYIYTLIGGSLFRSALYNLFKIFFHKLTCH